MKLEALKKIFWEQFDDADEGKKALAKSTEKLIDASYENGELEGFTTGMYAGAAFISAVFAVAGTVTGALYYLRMKKN